MKKLLFLLLIWLYPLLGFGAINECLTDVYYANGMQVDEGNATASTTLLERTIRRKFYNGSEEKMYKDIGKVEEAYNSTHGLFPDLFESFMQKVDLQLLIDWYALLKGYVTSHLENSRDQINAYKYSIMDGHKVLVVAHSQGNLFTGEAYIALGKESKKGWMQGYFEAVSVASPREADIKEGTERVDWDNDPVSRIATRGEKSSLMIENPTRKVSWESEPYIGEAVVMPSVNYVDVLQLNKMYKERYKAVEDGLDFSFNVHAFKYYMGEELGEGKMLNPFDDKPIKTDIAKIKIMSAIKAQLDKLEKVESQWKPKNLGCLCKDKYAKMTHIHDSALMNIRLEDEKVKNFAEGREGKIYSVSYQGKEQYVRAPCGGLEMEAISQGDKCFKLDNETYTLGYIEGDRTKNTDLPDGLFTASLSWHEKEVSIAMANELMPMNIESCRYAGLSSGALELDSVYPGTYPIGINAEGYEDLEDENISDIVTLKVKAVTARNTDTFEITKKYQYPNLGKGGHVADIVITQPEDPAAPPQTEVIPAVPISGGGNTYGNSGGGNSSPWIYFPNDNTGGGASTTVPVSRYNPPLCKTTDCACLPCEFSILSYLNQARLGPISGANVRLYKATEEDDINREILYMGTTGISNKIDEAGTLSLPIPYPQQTTFSEEEQTLIDAIAGYEGDFILEVSGGFDIDRDDDFTVDSSFTQMNGKLHLILSKERLLQNDYKVNILTEIGYQLSRDLLGESYDKVRLQERLNDIAKRVLIEKLYPNANQPLGRDDLFYWIPMAHKNWLLKPYDSTLAPIVNKVYAGENIYDEAYNYVYNPLAEALATVPVVKSQWFKADENMISGTKIGQISVVSEGNSSIQGYVLSGAGSELFRVEESGAVYLEENATLDYEKTSLYQLQLKALNEAGKSKPVTLYIVVGNILDVPEDRSFTGGVISEDAVEGDVAGVMTFAEGASAIERIEIGGDNKSDFTVDLNGTIRVSDTANFDYETSNSAKITLQAFNSLGGSRVVPIRFAIADAVDVPIVQMLDVHLKENSSVGTGVGKVNILSNDPLLSVVLSGSGKENFTIDLNGTVSVASGATLDYETRANYVLQVQASNIQGSSRLGTLVIRIDNIADVPQLGYTTLRMIEGSSIGTEVGKVNIETNGSTPITQFTLTGIGAENFNIDTQGVIRVITATLSHSDQKFFNLSAMAINIEGESLRARVVIYIDTQRPILGILDGYAYENSVTGTLIGRVPLASSATPISAIRLEGIGSEKFRIDLQRNVKVADDVVLDYETKTRYVLQVIATNEAGESDAVPLYIRVIDRSDTLKIAGFTSTIYEDIPEDTTVGFISIVDLGGKTIDHYELSGAGSENFDVLNSGLVKVRAAAQLNSTTSPKYHMSLVAVDTNGVKSNQVFIDISVVKNMTLLPHISEMSLTVQEDVSVETVLGQTRIVSQTQIVEQAWLAGEGNEAFELLTDGSIKLKQNLDYEVKKTYHLMMYARNSLGQSLATSLDIFVVNVPEHVPVLKPFIESVDEKATIGTVIGTIKELIGGDSLVSGFILNGLGKEHFNIDSRGTVKLIAKLDHTTNPKYTLEVIARNAAGDSIPVGFNINVIPPDITNPEITLRGNNTISVVQGTPYLDLGARAYDDRDGDISARIVVDNLVDTNAPVGTTYIVSYNVSDLAGNKASTQTRSITIVRDLNINLTDWKANGTGNWVLQADHRTILQTLNADPTMYHNNVDSQSDIFELTGAITVKTSSDDDFIGFVLGYKNGDLDKDDVDYLLIDWKQGDQSGGKKGLAISRVTKKLAPGAWAHDVSKGVTELQRGTSLGNVGWRDNTSYIFRITFTSTLVEVFINDVKELSITGEFNDGAYGFYNFSQGSVLYSAIRAEANTNIPPTANAGIDQNITVGTEVILDGTGSMDDIGIASYLWQEEDNILSYDSGFSIDDLSLGLHTITLTVEDDEGENDSDDVVVIVNEEL